MSSAKFDKWFFSNGNPVRTVINVQDQLFRNLGDTYITISNNTEYDTPISMTYKPKFANSLLFIHATTQIRVIETYGMSMGIKRDGAKIPGNQNVNGMDFFFKGESVNHHVNLQARAWIQATSTAPTTFQVWIRTHPSFASGSGTGEHSWGWGQHMIQVMEISQ